MADPVEKIPVTMTDGRVVGFGKKQRLSKSYTIEGNVVAIRLDFVNGETRGFTVPDSLLARFAAHGAEQKLGDAIVNESDIGDAIVSVDDLIARLSAGEWTAQRTSGGFAGTSILAQALMEATSKDRETIMAYLSTKSQAEKLALRRSDKVKPIIDRLEADKAKTSKSTIDTDSLLGELGLGGGGKPKKAEAA
jgi:hypothetical protein